MAPQLSQLGASVWKLANCSARLAKLPPLRSTFMTPALSRSAALDGTDLVATPLATAGLTTVPAEASAADPGPAAGSPAFLAASRSSASASVAAAVEPGVDG